MNRILISILLVQLAFGFSTDWSLEFDYESYIDENELFKLYWTDLPNDIMEFGIEVKAVGWVALGISKLGQMPNSDIAIGWIDDNGNAYLQDRHTISRTAPLYDTNQNLTLIDGEEVDGYTRIRFTRPKYTCDDEDLSLGRGTTRLIWAFQATEDPTKECWDSASIIPHTNKGSRSINLDSGIPEQVELENDIWEIDILMDKVAVPSSDTTYYCKLFQLPVYSNTHHIVKFEPLIEGKNEGTVHHLIAYYCPEYLVPESSHIGNEGPCDDWDAINMPSAACRQQRIVYGWAVGGTDLYMPEQAGIAISGGSQLHYILMEIHYDNPLQKSGIIDSSGFRMYTTPTLRKYEVGNMGVGLNINSLGQWIPPGLHNAHNQAFMTSACTESTIPNEGLTVFAANLHAHTIGKALNLRLVRNGTELPPILTDLNYDFNFQQTIYLDEAITIFPGDEFILDCWTDSSDRTYQTTGGESSSQEMCLGGFMYYPAIDMQYTIVSKTKDAFKAWTLDAQIAGYLSGDSSDIELIFDDSKYINDPFAFSPDLSSLTYYSDKDGALEFYNRLYSKEYEKYNKHHHWCFDPTAEYGIMNVESQDNMNVSIPEFEEYDLGVSSCENIGIIIDHQSQISEKCVASIDKSHDVTTTTVSTGTGGDIQTTNKGEIIKAYLSIILSIFLFFVV